MSYTLIRETSHIARKPHRCIWCGLRILAGERYIYEFSTYDGDTQRHKWHPECRAASREYFAEGESEFSPHENERPPSAATLEYESWVVADLRQHRLNGEAA